MGPADRSYASGISAWWLTTDVSRTSYRRSRVTTRFVNGCRFATFPELQDKLAAHRGPRFLAPIFQ
jgi:hypothetical protein